MNTTSIHWTGTRTARLMSVAAAAITVVALAGIASSTAAAAKPVPTITVVSCKIVLTPAGFLGTQITISWSSAGKVKDPSFIFADRTTVNGAVSHTDELRRRNFTDAELKANEVTFNSGLVNDGDVITIDAARWLDADSNVVVSSTGAPVLCTP